jgi:hypothetical protein
MLTVSTETTLPQSAQRTIAQPSNRASEAPSSEVAMPTPPPAATGRNPISIVAQCHRVVGATGTLTAGGLNIKAHLLAFERASA